MISYKSQAELNSFMDILDNRYNRQIARGQPVLKLWRYAGLILTYRCSAACAFCYYCCGPDKGGLMDVDTALSAWQGLVRLAGPSAKIHLTGGEPFLYFDRLAQIIEQARRQNLKGLEYIETNASWAVDTSQIRERLKFLDANGLDKLKISWDIFHAEFIDREKVLLLKEVAQEVLGQDRVLVRWQRYLQEPVKIRGLEIEEKKELYCQALRQDSCRFTGRAAFQLADLVAALPVESFSNMNCKSEILGAKGIHIDPYGNVFSGQCSGVAVGNVRQMPLDEIWRQFDPTQALFWQTLANSGPFGFFQQAIDSGYVPLTKYASKCHLCTHLRRFFFDKKLFWPIITPEDCYL
jgi:MoaA/NifB/PqqE/SkfB family radical SAM enzyme